MITPSSILLDQFKSILSDYARVYHGIYNRDPQGVALRNMVNATIDTVDDPKVRARLRNAIKVLKVNVKPTSCFIIFIVEEKAIKFFNKYLS